MNKDQYYRLSFYWFGVCEGILLTAIPSAIFMFYPLLTDVLNNGQSPTDLTIFWIRSASLTAIIGGLTLFVIFLLVRDLKAHLGVLSCYLLGDFIYFANLIHSNSIINTTWLNRGFLTLFTTVAVLTAVRLYFIGYLIQRVYRE